MSLDNQPHYCDLSFTGNQTNNISSSCVKSHINISGTVWSSRNILYSTWLQWRKFYGNIVESAEKMIFFDVPFIYNKINRIWDLTILKINKTLVWNQAFFFIVLGSGKLLFSMVTMSFSSTVLKVTQISYNMTRHYFSINFRLSKKHPSG